MIDAKRVEEMKRLSTEATSGEWKTDEHRVYSEDVDDEYICEMWLSFADAQFIAESRQFVPDIIAAYEEQAEEIAKLRKALEKISEMFVWNSRIRDVREAAREALRNE